VLGAVLIGKPLRRVSKGTKNFKQDGRKMESEIHNQTVWVCQKCGSEEVHVQAWVHANTDRFVDDCDPGKCWCCKCEDHSQLATKEEYIGEKNENNKSG